MYVKLINRSGYEPEHHSKLVNGCGPDGWKGALIPDSFLGVSIHEACNIHDFDYHCASSEGRFEYPTTVHKKRSNAEYWTGVDQRLIDLNFLSNMKTCIRERSKEMPFYRGKMLNPIRNAMAEYYYRKVKKHGHKYISKRRWEVD